MSTEIITWTNASVGLPDSDETVLIKMRDADEPVWLGYYGDPFERGAEAWHYIDHQRAEGVMAWAPMPAGPQ